MVLASLLLASVTELVYWIHDGQGTLTEPADQWTTFTLGEPEADQPWKQIRFRVAIDGPVEAGEWLLRVGPGGAAASAELGGAALSAVEDGLQLEAARVGPAFRLPHTALTTGANTIQVRGATDLDARRLAQGPVYLLPPSQAQYWEGLLDVEPAFELSAMSTLVSLDQDGIPGRRIVGRVAPNSDAWNLLGQLQMTNLKAGVGELGLPQLSGRQRTSSWPIGGCLIEDPDRPNLKLRITANCITADRGPLFSRTPLFLFEFRHLVSKPEPFLFEHRVRFFPAVGGALRAVRNENYLLLHNDRVGVMMTNAKLLGTEAHPLGFELLMEYEGPKPGVFVSLRGPTAQGAVFEFAPHWVEGTQVPDLEELATRIFTRRRDITQSTRTMMDQLARLPAADESTSHLVNRLAVRNGVHGFGVFGGTMLSHRDGDPLCAAAFVPSGIDQILLPRNSARALTWMAQTQREDGAVMGAAFDRSPRAQWEADVIAVLRVLRHFQWTWDAESAGKARDFVHRALAHARSIDDDRDGIPDLELVDDGSEPGRYASIEALALMSLAAHRQAAAMFEYLGEVDLAAELSAYSELSQTALTRTQAEGGWWTGTHFDAGLETAQIGDQATAILLDALPAEFADPLWAAAVESGDTDRVVLARGHLHRGEQAEGLAQLRTLEAELELSSVPYAPELAGYYDAVLFGYIGLRRDDLGVITVMPRIKAGTRLHTPVPFAEGNITLRLDKPDAQFYRMLSVQNHSDVPLLVRIGVPGGLGRGERIQIGTQRYSVYEEIAEPNQTVSRRVR